MIGKLIYITALVALVVSCGTGTGRSSKEDSRKNGAGDELQSESAGAAEGVEVDFDGSDLPEEFQGQSPPAGAGREFSTDFSRATISYDQVMSGGPPKDGIPAVDDPSFVDIAEADEWMSPNESVMVVSLEESDGSGDGEKSTRVYPIQILMWHEIVNDSFAGRPVTVTYCPLCNTGIAFDRKFDGRTLDFGTTGRLRYSNLIMYDRRTESWWQQATGRAIAGTYAGARLDMVPMLMLPWNEVKEEHPDAEVLSRDTGYNRSYGRNPYRNYDSSDSPFLYSGPTDDEFSPMTRVVTVFHNDDSQGFPYPTLREERAVTETIGGEEIVVFWHEGTASPLDSGDVSEGRDVGTANAFFSEVDGQSLSFTVEGDEIVDEETGSTWEVTGRAVDGPLEGNRLSPVTTSQHFWFSWTAFEDESG